MRNQSTSVANSPPACTPTIISLGSLTLYWATDVSIDAAGNLFVSDFGPNYSTTTNNVPVQPKILEVHAGTGTVTQVTNAGTGCKATSPWSIESDPAGNLIIGDNTPIGIGMDGYEDDTGRVLIYPAGGGNCTITTSFLGTTLGGIYGSAEVNLSPSGDIYVMDSGNNRVIKEQRSVVPTVAFTHSTVAGHLDTTDGTQTVQISNIGNTTLAFNELTYPADFAAGSTSNQCTSSINIAINGTCYVAIELFPQHTGSLSENVILGNNANGGTQSIPVTGTATGVAPSFTSGTSTTFAAGALAASVHSQTVHHPVKRRHPLRAPRIQDQWQLGLV